MICSRLLCFLLEYKNGNFSCFKDSALRHRSIKFTVRHCSRWLRHREAPLATVNAIGQRAGASQALGQHPVERNSAAPSSRARGQMGSECHRAEGRSYSRPSPQLLWRWGQHCHQSLTCGLEIDRPKGSTTNITLPKAYEPVQVFTLIWWQQRCKNSSPMM